MNEPYKATTASEKALPENMGVCVRIEQAANGVIVEAHAKTGSYNEKQYVFTSIEAALQEIPSIMSVTQQEAKDSKDKSEVCDD